MKLTLEQLRQIVDKCPSASVQESAYGWTVYDTGSLTPRDCTPAPYMTELQALNHAVDALHCRKCPASNFHGVAS